MSFMVPRKAYQIIALLLVCMAVGATFACQIHLEPSSHEHEKPDMHPTASATHSGPEFSCTVAVLPVMMVFLSWSFVALHATPRVFKHTVPVFPPFIPPRSAAL